MIPSHTIAERMFGEDTYPWEALAKIGELLESWAPSAGDEYPNGKVHLDSQDRQGGTHRHVRSGDHLRRMRRSATAHLSAEV